MHFSEKILKYVMIIFLIITVYFFTLGFVEFASTEDSSRMAKTLYNYLTQYNGVYSFTLAIVATYFGLKRLRLSQESSERALSQFLLTQEEIERRRKVDKKSETLKLCEFYLTEFQISLKELIQKNQYSGMPIQWPKLDKINRESLETNYPTTFTRIEKAEQELRMESIILLQKLNAFCASILHGNTDLTLAKGMIGDIFCKQFGLLTGLIAYYQTEGSELIFKSILDLNNIWIKE